MVSDVSVTLAYLYSASVLTEIVLNVRNEKERGCSGKGTNSNRDESDVPHLEI